MTCPPAIFLPLLQGQLPQPTAAEQLKDRFLGEHEAAQRDPIPARREAALADIRQREKEAWTALFRELDGTAFHERFVAAVSVGKLSRPRLSPKQRQRRANRRQDATPERPEICLWSSPMSVADYRDATGRNRKTVDDFLKSIKAQPAIKGRHAAEAARYPVEINLRVLEHWLAVWTTDPVEVIGLAAATRLPCRVWRSRLSRPDWGSGRGCAAASRLGG